MIVRPVIAQDSLSKDKRMEWWREARFGMFVHFGTYAQWGGVYHGHEQAHGGAEWIMNRAKIPIQEYIDTAKNFNPVNYNPDAWAKMAKDAGMKYLVVTTKHHDGFALFNTKASNWNAVTVSTYGRDLIAPLAVACKKYGIKLGFYYSQSQDWVNPGGAVARKPMKEGWANPDSTQIDAYTAQHKGHWDALQQTKTFDEYINDVAVPQVKELLTNYGEIAVFWWDTPMDISNAEAQKFKEVLKLQPQIITNDRLKRPNFSGDTKTPEQKIPDRSELDGEDWESCMTMNTSWGYKSWDDDWKSSQDLIRNLINSSSKGGNYLLNIGPKPDGSFPQESIDRLQKIGAWMKVNSEAIYGSKANPLKEMPWGRITRKENKKGTVLYLSVFDWPANGQLLLSGLNLKVKSAKFLATETKLEFKKEDSNLNINVPTEMPNKVATVIKVQLKGEIKSVVYKNGKMHTGEID
ncbi:Alpha-L-fucosidase [Arcticibacter svalbardensis MN12-7]|uniref:alpha-L-fucosidase n=1 Tax=Arcticibacter svalbardensis MN12-7 TaxID=1150600 RepID=R9GX51_9SPHI|nr:Alpha-L-fucosidase [Arcticibacter svalbardensis MN12-7]